MIIFFQSEFNRGFQIRLFMKTEFENLFFSNLHQESRFFHTHAENDFLRQLFSKNTPKNEKPIKVA